MDEPNAQDATGAATSARSSLAGQRLSPDRTVDDASFIVFYRSSLPRLVAFLRWQGVPLSDATEVAQETMVQAYQHWATVEHPPAWVRRVASRMWARRIAQTVENAVDDVPQQHPLLTATDVAAWEQRHDVLRILDQLAPRQRQVLAWTLDGFTPTAIELKMTPEAVRASLVKARRAVAMILRSMEKQS